MSFFQWDPVKYDVGVARMNADHQGLIKLMNAIHERDAAGAPKAEIATLFGKLGEATQRHFAAEEAYMESVAFPDIKSHKLIHARLLQDFGKHVVAFSAGGGRVSPDFFSFLSLWLRSHICHLDTKYGRLAGVKKAV